MGALALISLLLALVTPVLAADPRCDTQPDRPFCEPDSEPTTTTTIVTTTTLPETTTTTVPETTTTAPTTTTVPETTTTTVGETTTTTMAPENPFDAVSVVGCSNTNHAASGYLDASELDLLVNTAWAGHTVEYWATKEDGWVEHYLPLRPETGFDGAWLNLCERAEAGLTQENVDAVLAKIWEIDPGIPIWISPLNYYEGEDCEVTAGNSIPNDGAIIADTTAATYELVSRGPDLGPLSAEQLRRDLCHPNQLGIDFLGLQLVDFFDSDPIASN